MLLASRPMLFSGAVGAAVQCAQQMPHTRLIMSHTHCPLIALIQLQDKLAAAAKAKSETDAELRKVR